MENLSPEPDAHIPVTREQIHDLRTLFAVIASGGHMLGDKIDPRRRGAILGAIEDAAMRGGKITTGLLAASCETGEGERCELARRLANLRPLLEMLLGNGTRLDLDIAIRPTLLRCRPERLDHVVLELVANARAACDGRGRVTVRARRVGTRVWILVGDTGSGMDGAMRDRLLGPVEALQVGRRGGGLRQLRGFARDMNGRLRIHSVPARGTVVALILPIMSPEPAAPATARKKEFADAG